jgi:hypothetical protein
MKDLPEAAGSSGAEVLLRALDPEDASGMSVVSALAESFGEVD